MEEFDLFSNGTWIGDAERYPRMGEYIRVIKGLWTDPDFKFNGTYYRAHVRAALTGADGKVVMPEPGEIVAKASHLPYPPIYAASRSPQGKALIAQHGDVWFAEYQPGYRNFESNIERMAADVRAMDDLPHDTDANCATRSTRRSSAARRRPRLNSLPRRPSRMPDRVTGWSMRWGPALSEHRNCSPIVCAATRKSASKS
jgi:alkanesulfonate monooxygenase SsuD/methylene tetrahydromethanopterin reductase-like flavin-dependent oxidoreductase (luciferase family)